MPSTYSELTSRRVLTVSWLDGEKLSQSKADNVGDLVNIGVICYLKQLLDTGFFHADPHPGNLIRTPDGRLAILDFGLVSVLGEAGFWNHLKPGVEIRVCLKQLVGALGMQAYCYALKTPALALHTSIDVISHGT